VRAEILEVLGRAQALGFLGPAPVDAHLAHALAFAAAGDPPDLALDLGAGGGVPGLVLAAVWPDARWVLLDAGRRRTTFLSESVARLGWSDRIVVRRDRAEVAGRDVELRGRHELVVARSFASPPVTAECGAPFLRVGGRLLVSEPPEPRPDSRWDDAGLARLGLRRGDTVVDPDAPATIQALLQAVPCGDEFPRRVGLPAKRPLW
jgi:16S rRNA (guanine527-N7)-methyltransferase